jgi:hypothetical protein
MSALIILFQTKEEVPSYTPDNLLDLCIYVADRLLEKSATYELSCEELHAVIEKLTFEEVVIALINAATNDALLFRFPAYHWMLAAKLIELIEENF